jgi:parvulin-like peptidyl-prolyl isomerase
MPPTPWLQLGTRLLHLEELPALLERSNLLVPLLRRLLLEQAIATVEVTMEEQAAHQQRFLAHNGIDSREKLDEWLQRNGLSEDQASRNILESLQLESLKRQRFSAELEKVFLDSKHDRDRVVYSLLRLKDQQAAIELHLRLDEGDATFTDLSQEHSAGPERETGGLIGPIAMGRLHPQLAELLRISKPGQLWHPMPIDDWWVIVRLDKKLPAQLDGAMEEQLRDECFEQWVSQQLEQFMTAYRQAQQASAPPIASPPPQELPPPSAPPDSIPPDPNPQDLNPPEPNPPDLPPPAPSTSSPPPAPSNTSDDQPKPDESSEERRFPRLWPFGG